MNNKIMHLTNDYHQSLIESLADSSEAMIYLKVALEEYENDGDTNSFLLALKNVARTQGGIAALAEKTQLDRTHLYRILSSKGNPRLLTLNNILRAMGFRLSIEAA